MLTKTETRTPSGVLLERAIRIGTVLLSYCLVSYLINAAGLDLTRIVIGGGDTYTQGLPSKLFATGFSGWDPWVQLGIYASANTQFAPYYLPALLPLMLFHNVFGYNLFTLGHYGMAGFFFYLYARNLRLGSYAAYLGGLLFMCSGFLLGHKGHQALLGASVWLPLLLLFLDRYLRTRLIRDAAFAGAALGMSLLGGYAQTTTYMTILAVAYFSFRCLGDHSDIKRGGRLSIWATGLGTVCVVAVLIASLQLFAVAELLPTITREKISLEMFSQDSLPLPYLAALAIPGLFGGASGFSCYLRASSFIEFYSYMGQSALLLAAVAAIGLWNKERMIRFWVAAGTIAGVLCLGLQPIQRVLHLIPVYNLFRAPARHLYESDFAICMLAVYGVHALLNNSLERHQVCRALRVAFIGVGALLATAVCASQYIRYLAKHLTGADYSHAALLFGLDLQGFTTMARNIYVHLAPFGPTVLTPVLFFALSAVLLWQLSKRNSISWKVLLPLVMVLDIWLPYRTVYANPDATPLFHPESDSAAAFLTSLDRTHYRIYPIDPSTLYIYPIMNHVQRLATINDYSPFWEKRYQSIGQFDLDGESSTAYMSTKLMNELGVRYVITNRQVVADRLRHMSRSTDPPATPLPMPSENCAALNCAEASFPEPGVISLQHSNRQAAIIQIAVAFRPNALYKVSFEVRTQAVATAPLVVDLYANPGTWGGSGLSQSRYVMALGPEFTKTDVLIASVHMVAQNGYVRLFTPSPIPIEIRNLQVGIANPVPNAFREAYGAPNGDVVFENPGALPRFRFVRDLLPVSNFAEARAITLSAPFDPALQATVEGLSAHKVMDDGKVSRKLFPMTS